MRGQRFAGLLIGAACMANAGSFCFAGRQLGTVIDVFGDGIPSQKIKVDRPIDPPSSVGVGISENFHSADGFSASVGRDSDESALDELEVVTFSGGGRVDQTTMINDQHLLRTGGTAFTMAFPGEDITGRHLGADVTITYYTSDGVPLGSDEFRITGIVCKRTPTRLPSPPSYYLSPDGHADHFDFDVSFHSLMGGRGGSGSGSGQPPIPGPHGPHL